jgi:hypothetical protein
MTAQPHLSFYALDRVRLGDPPSAEEQAHLQACETCAAHLRPQDGPEAQPLPAWLANVQLPAPPARPARLSGWRLLWPGLTLATAVAAGLIGVWARPAPQRQDSTGVREKGGPAVQVFVKRGERVFTWSGRAVQPGDRLRVEVNGAGYGFVSVAGRSAAQNKPVVLYDGTLASGAQLLPLSFRVDAEGKQEILSVIFGRRPIPAELHVRAQEPLDPGGNAKAEPERTPGRSGKEPRPEDDAATWRQILVLDKEIP